MRTMIVLAASGLALLVVLRPIGAEGQPSIEDAAYFENQIRPLLERSCLGCHGPKKQESSLRLDSRAAMLHGGDRGPAIVPESPNESLLIAAIGYDTDLKMPPDGRLSQTEADLFATWIELGAPWPDDGAAPIRQGGITDEDRLFWSFQPLSDPTVPPVGDETWPSTHVDRFILASLEARGISPAHDADRRALLRRATFDLTGLPPTPDEIDDFLADESPAAFSRVVDCLLASPAYGERWGRHWLDVVRYADTAGETADFPATEAYRYRNYVIDSFNADRPYDEFIREQIAGDLIAARALREETASSKVYADRVAATGFLAISRRFGFDTEKYEHLTIQDTIDTLGQAVLGLTLGCARCHDHKFDPVTMADYYAMYGFFASTRYAFVGSERQQRVRALVPLIPPAQAAEAWADFDRRVAALETELAALGSDWPKLTLRSLADIDGDFELQAAPSGGSRGFPASPWIYRGEASIATEAQSPFTNAYKAGAVGASLAAGDGDHALARGLSPGWAGEIGSLLFVNLDLRIPASDATDGLGGYRIRLGHGADRAPAIELCISAEGLHASNGDAVDLVRPFSPGEWNNLRLEIDLMGRTYAGSIGPPDGEVAFSSKSFNPTWDGRIDFVSFDGDPKRTGPRPALEIDNLAIGETPFSPAQPPVVAAVSATDDSASPAGEDLERRRAEIRSQLAELIEAGPCPQAYAVVDGTPQDARIQLRGEPERQGELVRRRFLEILGGHPLSSDADGSGRLELAEWLTQPDNPLTARVMVNRIWQHHFGRGLVETESDFGSRGRRPSHPELLDWLAGRFIESGWSIKAMHRLVLNSRAYQMASSADPAAIAADPENAFVSRAARRRLDAESIRDALLFLGGSLDRSPGGRHPFPRTQDAAFTQHNPFTASYDSNRRGVYLMTQRLKRHPYLALFDGADSNAGTPRRVATTVPTQALFMMNDSFVHDQAAGFARRLIAATESTDQRIAMGFEMALARPPTAEETTDSLEFLERYSQDLAASRDRVGTGHSDDHRTAAWAAFARTLIGRNEFLYVD